MVVFPKVSQVDCGVPQESCLGPLLFSIFLNDLPLVLDKSQIAMYVDYATIYAAGSTTEIVNEVLERELKSVVGWVTCNNLVLNVGKTKSILIGSRYQLRPEPKLNLYINNIPVDQAQQTKLLGITLNHSLSWSQYTDNIVSKMGRGVSVIRRLSKGMPPDVI